MSSKLLHKTQKIYLIFSVLMLIVVATFFYFITDKLYMDETDEALLHRKSEFLHNSISHLKQTDIPVWNKFNSDILIREAKGLTNDTLFYSYYFDNIEQENEPYRELNSPIIIEGKPYTFVARINLVESEDFMKSIAALFLIIIFLLLFGLFLITKKLSLSLWKPFYETLQKIEYFEIDKNKQPQFPDTDIDEFNRLNQSIKYLIDKNILIFKNQREFVENAAHELQTPIAVFQAKIDTLIQRSDITHEQAEILSTLNDSVSRLNHLNKNLLLLSKIDNKHFDETEEFSVKELIEKQLGFFTEQAQQKNIHIKTELNIDIKLNANTVLAEILFSNLFLNAIQHNIQNGKINIHLTQHKLIFSNTGISKALLQEKLFSRFSKANPSQQGNGLGLAIVKKIADLNNWTINYTYSNSLHSFSVKF